VAVGAGVGTGVGVGVAVGAGVETGVGVGVAVGSGVGAGVGTGLTDRPHPNRRGATRRRRNARKRLLRFRSIIKLQFRNANQATLVDWETARVFLISAVSEHYSSHSTASGLGWLVTKLDKLER
jgi:hypothetical protein